MTSMARSLRFGFLGLSLALALSLVLPLMPAGAVSVTEQEPSPEGGVITPAGKLVLDASTRLPAVGSLPVAMVPSPDGRYLIVVNSGFGIQFNGSTNRGQQSLAVIDLSGSGEPLVIQNVYFPTPQSANVGVVFSQKPDPDRSFPLYVSGGVENKIWVFRYTPGAPAPIAPSSPGPATTVNAPFIDVAGFANSSNTPRYNDNRPPVYPAGLALAADGNTLFVANNLADNLGIVRNVRGTRELTRIELRKPGSNQFLYPYGILTRGSKVYVSLWGDASIAVVDTAKNNAMVNHIAVDRHPTAMSLNRSGSRLYAVNSDGDSVSVIDTSNDREIERISVKLSDKALIGGSPEGLALSSDGATLYVANAHSNAVAVVSLSAASRGEQDRTEWSERDEQRSRVRGFIPTGLYPSAIAFAGRTLFVGNGKGTGFENSSMVSNNSGKYPNLPNDRFPAVPGQGRGGRGGQYSLSLIAGNYSAIPNPDDAQLALYTQQVMRNDGLVAERKPRLFQGASPIKHVIYIIKENRTYDQLLGDVPKSGDGRPADGDPALAIFGSSNAARRPGGAAQDITPNQRALALRFGLMDRFFVNAAASPEGHNWSTAAFSNDYTVKGMRWNYSSRGLSYDFEGFNRLPEWQPLRDQPPMFSLPVTADDIAAFLQRHVPYLQGARDIAEPATLYLWDAAARAGLSYRNYGEFVATVSEGNVQAVNANRARPYPDLTPNVRAIPTKKSLEDHFCPSFRNFDLRTPDSMTTESYLTAKESNGKIDPLISNHHAEERFRGNSRLGEWLEEFNGFVADLEAGKADRMPNFSMVRLSNDHTNGLAANYPTPQFFVAENDYAVGRLVDAVSNSPYWKNTAIFIVEDDAQDGPEHVDCHRSPAFVISAYNRPGLLIHDFHNTVSLIRTMELLLGMEPMNQLDGVASPIDIFRDQPDLKPFKAILPEVATDNLKTPASADRDSMQAYWIKRTSEQDLSFADMADPGVMNEIIWYSVRGGESKMPAISRLAVVDAMREVYREPDEKVGRLAKRR